MSKTAIHSADSLTGYAIDRTRIRFTVKYTPGKDIGVNDCLSRLPSQQEDPENPFNPI